MAKLLQPKQTVVVTQPGGISVRVGEFLGGGLQGEVYVGTMAGEKVAVKWFRPQWIKADPGLPERLTATIGCRSPPARFLWPKKIVVCSDISGFGYVMPFREPRFREFRELICGQIDPSLRCLATAGLQIAECYHRLHLMGLCYIDINPGNVAFDPDTGEVRIGDCDNIDVNERGRRSAVTGTEGFMAPEIVMNQAYPTTWTDLWSLAVLLFWAFMRNHPLQGRKEHDLLLLTREDELRLWGREALFIFDENDQSNRPVEGFNDAVLQYWPIYPEFLRKLFIKAFTEGIHQPRRGRVFETDWRTAMAKLRDFIMFCSHCGTENFYGETTGRRCWACDSEIPEPRRIVFPAGEVVAADGAGLFAHHLDPRRTPDSSPPILSIVSQHGRPDVLELRNDGDAPYQVTLGDHASRLVAPGGHIAMEPGMRITIGRLEARVV